MRDIYSLNKLDKIDKDLDNVYSGEAMSEVNNSNTKKPNNKRRRYNKNKKKKPSTGINNDAPVKAKETSGNKNRNRRPKALSPSKIAQKYDNLLEQNLIARKKYFEMYARAKGQAYQKISNNYMRTLRAVFNFKSTLNEWQQETLDKKLELYPEDNQYTTTHNLPLTGEVEVSNDQIEDIHLTENQKLASYKDDTEESSGTIEDYKKYKDSMSV